LLTVTEAALAHLTLPELLDELLARIRELLYADTVAVLMLDDSGEQLVARGAKGLEEEVERGVTIPVGRGFAGRIAAERRPVIIDDVDHADILNPLLREKGIKSLLGVPLMVEGRVTGVMHVGSLTPRDFTQDDVELLQAAADRAALAIEHGQLYEAERHAREMAERRADAEALRRTLARQGLATRELEALIARMRALESQRVYDDPEEAARLQAAVADGLKAFEFALRRRVEGDRGEPLRLGTSDEVPAAFRALVEEYYRSLARGR